MFRCVCVCVCVFLGILMELIDEVTATAVDGDLVMRCFYCGGRSIVAAVGF